MIEKMQFLSVTGPKEEIDRVVDTYLSRYDFHPENALTELSSIADLKPFLAGNPYKESLAKAKELLSMAGKDQENSGFSQSGSIDQALETVTRLSAAVNESSDEEKGLKEEIAQKTDLLNQILPFESLDFNLPTLLSFRSVKYRFGRIPVEYIDKFRKYVYDDASTIFVTSLEDSTYVWGVYFSPESEIYDVDAVYKSLHFERIYLPDEYAGTPSDNISRLRKELAELNRRMECLNQKRTAVLQKERAGLLEAVNRLEASSVNFDIRKLAALTADKQQAHFILCGWMTKKDAEQLSDDLEAEPSIHCVLLDNGPKSTPPTRLKNPKFFRPFEMYVRMYGLPNYNEIDPTLFVAITYSFIFGWMFGDAGQGICLMIGGFLLYRFKKMNLAAIIGTAGIFSTIFGFLFGSFFGFEDVIPALWMRPMNAMSTLPFVGRLNTVFVFSIGFGMFLILFAMIIHMINAARQKDFNGLWLDTNGLAGLVFYGSLVLVILLFMTGNSLPAGILLAVLFGLPLILIAFKEPIGNLLQKKKSEEKTGAVMMGVQAVFELIEVLLSYFSNTISFVRIGAFAISHAAMMEVVLMLAGATSGTPNWIVVVLGNAFVCGMEGLVVGIQVLRLEYYEMFSRFYRGDGKEFTNYLKRI